MREPFVLSPSEAESPLWQRLKAFFEAELQTLRERNDDSIKGEEPERTDNLRGQIKQVKKFLALEKPIRGK